MVAFWGGLTSQDSGSEFGKLIYFAINMGLILIGAALTARQTIANLHEMG